MSKSLVKLVTLVLLAFVVSACGKRPQVVTGLQVQSQVIQQDVWISLSADLDLGAMSFPAVTIPILHPKGQQIIGSVGLQPVLGGKNQMKVSVDVSALADIQASIAALPNGNSVPLIANNPTIVVPLGSGAQLYLTLTQNAVALGVAIPIKTFDGMGSSIGNVNLFPVFTIDKAVGAAGIFTGRQAGQNGFALIVDVTKFVQMQNIYVPTADVAQLNYASQIPASSAENKINSMILRLNSQAKKLQLH